MNNKIRVLIADDNKSFCNILKKILEKNSQITVIGIAYTKNEEIEQIKKMIPDIVITDLLKGKEYSGIDIIKEYNKKNKNIRFFVISSEINVMELNNIKNIIGYMRKPFIDYDNLIDCILEIKKDNRFPKMDE